MVYVRRVTQRWLVAVGLLLALLHGASSARAQSARAMREARQAYRDGEAAFAAGNYPEALVHFQRGYELSGRPRFLLNIGHSQQLMGQLEDALVSYRKFLESDPRPEDRQHAVDAIAAVEADLEKQRATPVAPAPPPPPVAPTSPPEPAPTVTAAPAPPAPPLHKRWYTWAAVGAAVLVGVTLAVALSGSDGPTYVENGSWGRLDPPSQ